MKKLLALLLLSPLAFSEPSKNTQDYLWNKDVSLLTFGLYLCDKHLGEEDKEEEENHAYLKWTGTSCSYVFDKDQILLRANVLDIEGLYKDWTEEGFTEKLMETGEMSLDMAQQGCQKVAKDLFSLGMALTEASALNPYTRYFTNKGIVEGGTDLEAIEMHVRDMFRVMIRLSFNNSNDSGYTCEAIAKDKKYKLGDKINFSVKKENDKDFYDRLY